jgi:dihydroorotate dehydrogenase
LNRAAEDYRESFRLLHDSGAYFVVNVSSPNTPGLRTLQERGPLTEIIAALSRSPRILKWRPSTTLSGSPTRPN